MKMKKAIAGILASVVAISAIATMAVSADTANNNSKITEQAASSTTFDFTGTAYPVSWKGTASAAYATPGIIGNAADLKFTFAFHNTVLAGALLKVDTATLAVTGKHDDTDASQQTVSFPLIANDDGTFYISSVTNAGDVASNSIIDLSYFDEIDRAELSYTMSDKSSATKNAADTLAAKEFTSFVDITSTTKAGVAVAPAAGSAWASIFASFDNQVVNSGKGTVGTAAKTHGVYFSNVNATNTVNSGKVPVTVNKDGEIAYGPVSNIHPLTSFSPAGNNLFASATIAGKNISSFAELNDLYTNLRYGVSRAVANNKGATVTLKLYTPSTDNAGKTPDSIDGIIISASASATSADMVMYVNAASGVNTIKQEALIDSKANTVTFDWDKITAASGFNGSAGLVNDIVLGTNKAVTIESITVNVPAKTIASLAAGAPTTEASVAAITTAAGVTTAAPVAAATTSTNPKTGNAPIALAVIPVAIIAAAVIAKKRG